MDRIRFRSAPVELGPVMQPPEHAFLRRHGVMRLSAGSISLQASFFNGLASLKQTQDHVDELIQALRSVSARDELKKATIASDFLERLNVEDQITILHCLHTCDHLTIGTKDDWSYAFSYAIIQDLNLRDCQTIELHGLCLGSSEDAKNLAEKVSDLQAVKLCLDLQVGKDLCYENSLDSILDATVAFTVLELSAVSFDEHRYPLVSRKSLEEHLRQSQTANLTLRGLGLQDDHCDYLVAALSSFQHLRLEDNLITDDGYSKIYRQLSLDSTPTVSVDHADWKNRFKMIQKMNLYGRPSYTNNGNFERKEQWVNWLIRLSNCRQDPEAPMFWLSFEDTAALYQTIRDSPEFMKR